MRILHIITGLTTGGAEMMLYKILCGFSAENQKSVVICLGDQGRISELIKSLRVQVSALGMLRSKLPSFVSMFHLITLVRSSMPDLIQGWMYHGNLAASFGRFFLGSRVPLAWNIRQTIYDTKNEKKLTRLVIKANAFFSNFPDAIIYNSTVSAKQHEKLGFSSLRAYIIPNGFDTTKFYPSSQIKEKKRRELSLSKDVILVGLIGRFHPMKDHHSFIQAAKHIKERFPEVHFLMLGNGVDKGNIIIMEHILNLGLEDSFLLLGERHDIPELMASIDICVSASAWGEGFPNVVGEAMSCGVPCVVTDVGDSALVVGNAGFVVPPRNSKAISEAVCKLIEQPVLRSTMGLAARERIISEYSLETVVQKYQSLYQTLINKTLSPEKFGE